jgi:hypothetical protein
MNWRGMAVVFVLGTATPELGMANPQATPKESRETWQAAALHCAKVLGASLDLVRKMEEENMRGVSYRSAKQTLGMWIERGETLLRNAPPGEKCDMLTRELSAARTHEAASKTPRKKPAQGHI